MILNLSHNRKVDNYREDVSHCRALSVCNLVLILLIGSSHQALQVNDEIYVALSLVAYDRSGGFLHFVQLIPI